MSLPAFKQLKNIAVSALNTVLPPLCISCEEMVSDSHGFCGACWKSLGFIAAPYCACCGLPFEYEAQGFGDAALCGQCLMETPKFKEARAAWVYNENSKKMILPFKHSDRTDFSPALARVMAVAGKDMLEKSDVIIPVPLHFIRLFTRRYNQAALLAKTIGTLSRKTVLLDVLTRKKATPSQGHLSREQRYENVKNAFAVNVHRGQDIKGKNIMLIDDVLTTGATANACAATLLKAGAKEIRVLTLARVVKVDA